MSPTGSKSPPVSGELPQEIPIHTLDDSIASDNEAEENQQAQENAKEEEEEDENTSEEPEEVENDQQDDEPQPTTTVEEEQIQESAPAPPPAPPAPPVEELPNQVSHASSTSSRPPLPGPEHAQNPFDAPVEVEDEAQFIETPASKTQYEVHDDKDQPRRSSTQLVFSSSPVHDGESAIPSLPKLASENSVAHGAAVEEETSHVSGAVVLDDETEEKDAQDEEERDEAADEKDAAELTPHHAEDQHEEPEKVDNRARLMQPEVVPMAPADEESGESHVRKILEALPSEPSDDDIIHSDSDDGAYDTCGEIDSIGQFESCGSLTDGNLSPAE